MRRAFFIAFLLAGLFSPLLTRAADSWVEVRSPNFIVVSNSGEKDARNTAIRFEQIRALFREAMPAATQHQTPPITILALKDEHSLSLVLPEYWTKGHFHPAGIFENGMNQFYIAIELDAQGSNPYSTIYHEYYHSLSMPYFPDMPTWLSEGLADYFGHSEVDTKTATLGQPAPELIYQLTMSSLIPLDQLFRVDRSSPYYNEESKTTIFYAESWALVHYLMIGDRGIHQSMLRTYLQELSQGTPPDQAAAKAFGNLKKLGSALNDYVARNSFYEMHYPAPARTAESELKTRVISEAEADAYEGGFLATRGRDDDASKFLNRSIALDPKIGLARQNLALAQFDLGRRQEALASASQAIDLDPQSSLARFFRAYLSFAEAPGQANPQIEDDLHRVIQASPEFAPPYGLLAVYLVNQRKNLPEALTLAHSAIALEPGNSEFRINEAQVLMAMDKYPEARAAATRARDNAATSQELLRADVFLSTLDTAERYSRPNEAEVAIDSDAASASTPERISDDTAQDGTKDASVLRHRDAPPKNQDQLEATGTVASVTCSRGIQMQLSTSEGNLDLRSAAGLSVTIESATAIPPDFSPCKLKGAPVFVKYAPDAVNPRAGLLEVLRLVDQPADNSSQHPPSH